MPRLPRLHVPGGCYHVILRGNHRQALFASHEDRSILNDIVAEVLVRQRARIHAFCWMTNHLHALVQVSEVPLGAVMQLIAQRYSRYRHLRMRTTGHLFERRYKAWLVDVDIYFVALLRYIHLNPLKARIVTNLDDYPWSSHHAYSGTTTISWLSVEFGLSLLGTSIEAARATYRTLINQPPFASEDRLHDDANPQDARILGTDQFLTSLKVAPYMPKSKETLEEFARKLCDKCGESLQLVCSRSRQRNLTRLRVEIAREAIDRRIVTLSELAAFFKRDPASLSELLARHSHRST
jgi:REP element-mobilizing transposase RayT